MIYNSANEYFEPGDLPSGSSANISEINNDSANTFGLVLANGAGLNIIVANSGTLDSHMGKGMVKYDRLYGS